MTGAMYAAISGLKSHMSKLNVIGNNIANVNTYAYKAQRTVFSDSLYTTSQAGSNGTTTVGGRNPSQYGYGVQISSIDLDMTTGNYSPTGINTDCMIQGDGFFLVGDKTVANTINKDNADSLKNLTLTRAGNFEFKADGYLSDGTGEVVYGFLCTGYDSTNEKWTYSDKLVPICFPRMKVNDDGTVEIIYPDDDAKQKDEKLPFASLDSISIDNVTGKITGIAKDSNDLVTIGFIAIGNVTNPAGVTHQTGPYFKAQEGAGALQVTLLGGAGEDAGLTAIDGSTLDGMKIGSAGTTSLITGGLEMSKTDLATEISEMITTQRGYQANTRIITVTDSMLEELVNIKR